MSKRFSKKELLDGAKRINAWIKKGTGLPGYVTLTDRDGKKQRLYPKEYAGVYESMNMFRLNNGRDPNFVALTSTANNPLVFDRQNTSYNCCPTSLSMASQMLYNYKSESVCSKALGTNPVSGTSPAQLIANAPKLGFKIIPIERKAKAVKQQLAKGFPVICHWQVDQTKACKGDYVRAFGHYGLIWNTTDTEYVVADPAKGVSRKYKFLCLDNANKGYRQNYYAVTPK